MLSAISERVTLEGCGANDHQQGGGAKFACVHLCQPLVSVLIDV